MINETENVQSFGQSRETVKRTPISPEEPTTIAELFLKAEKNYSRKDALNYKKNGVWNPISTPEMISRIKNIALGLYSLGLRHGDRAAILADNSPEWTLADAGCQFSGVIDVPIYTTLMPNSVEYIIKDSGTKIFFIQNKKSSQTFLVLL